MIKKIFFSTLILLLFISNSFAQEKQNPSQQKIAFVIESLFFDKKVGIKDFSSLANLKSDNGNNINQNESVNNSKSNPTVYNPAKELIYGFLKQIENQNNLIIINLSETDSNGQILALNQKFDLTKKIITFINNKSAKSVETFKIDLPEAKVGFIDTSLFYDKEKGIKQLTKNLSKYNNFQELCSKTTICSEIGNSVQTFAMKKGFSLVFDSSKNLPAGISNFPKTDITQEFISDFNKNN